MRFGARIKELLLGRDVSELVSIFDRQEAEAHRITAVCMGSVCPAPRGVPATKKE